MRAWTKTWMAVLAMAAVVAIVGQNEATALDANVTRETQEFLVSDLGKAYEAYAVTKRLADEAQRRYDRVRDRWESERNAAECEGPFCGMQIRSSLWDCENGWCVPDHVDAWDIFWYGFAAIEAKKREEKAKEALEAEKQKQREEKETAKKRDEAGVQGSKKVQAATDSKRVVSREEMLQAFRTDISKKVDGDFRSSRSVVSPTEMWQAFRQAASKKVDAVRDSSRVSSNSSEKGVTSDRLQASFLQVNPVDIPKDQVRRIQDLKDAFKIKDIRQRELVPSAAGSKEQVSPHLKNLGKFSLVALELPPKGRTDLHKPDPGTQVIKVNAKGEVATLANPLPKPTVDQVTMIPVGGRTGKLAVNPQPVPLPKPAASQAKGQKADDPVPLPRQVKASVKQAVPRPVNTAALGRRQR